MIDSNDLRRWVHTLGPGSGVAVDDGGLTLVEIGPDNQPTGNYLEIGGTPADSDSD